MTSIKVAKSYTNTFLASGVYNAAMTLVYDANGLVIGHAGYNLTMMRCAKDNSGAVVWLTDNTSDPTGTNTTAQGYVVDANTVAWVCDTVNGTARVATAADFAAATWVAVELAADGTVETALIMK